MAAHPEDSLDEIKRLQRGINDLLSVVSLSAIWTGLEPSQIVPKLLDALLGVLRLDFVYAQWVGQTGAKVLEAVRFDPGWEPALREPQIGEILHQWLGYDPQRWPAEARKPFGDEHIALVTSRLGLRGEIGLIVAGSQRADFPGQTERLVLSVAANQAAIGLQGAALLSEQKRVAGELDQQVAKRTAELAASNQELRKEIVERTRAEEALRESEQGFRLIVDGIAGLVAIMTPAGKMETVNRQVLEYFGKTPEELEFWTTTDAVHPGDLPGVASAWARSIETGAPYDVDHRLRRADGAYRWFHARGLPLLDEVGRVLHWYVLLTDIDDRVWAEETIRQREKLFRTILDGLPAFVAFMAPSGDVEFANRTLLEYFDATLDEVKSWPSGSTLHPDEREEVLRAWWRSIESGEPFNVEARHRRMDGVYRWFQLCGAPLRDADGQILSWYLMQIDVDDRKRAEQALGANERELGLIVNTMPTLAWSARPDGFAEFFNQYYRAYVGLTLEQLQGSGWTVAVHPDDLGTLAIAWQTMMATGKEAEVEARLRRFDGEYRWFLFRTNPMRDEAGNILKWYGTNADIDGRKRAEEQLQRSEVFLLEGQKLSGIGNFSWLVAADEIKWSEQLYRIFEFEPGAPVTFDLIGSRVHPEDRPLLSDMIAKAQRGVSDFEYEPRLLMPDRSIKYLHLIGHRSRDHQDRPEYIGAVQDVTQRRLSQEALGKARSELANVSKMTSLGVLTASIAHEVNQPLSGIVTNASTCLRMLSADPPNVEGARETARRAIRDGNRASDVVTRLRTLYSKKDLSPESMDLNEAAREVTSLSLSDLQSKRVVLRYELADDLPPVVGDRVQLQQVILNLVRNAADAMEGVEDRPRDLLIKTESDAEDRVRLSVKDAGVGFDPQAADKLFEAFFTTKSDGMGVGLSVSRSIIESHRGRLWAARNDGPGATFSFSIPCGRRTVTQAGSAGAV